MHSSMIIPTYFLALLLTTSSVALPVQHAHAVMTRTVYNSPITAPPAKAIFAAGASTTVTWDTAEIPADSHPKGMLVLGYTEGGKSDEHLDIHHPLATDFDLRAGAQKITFPEHLPTRAAYIIVLFGDSGNRSPPFTITARS